MCIKNEEAAEFISRYEICDAHAHIFPEKISRKAVASIGDFYGIPMSYSTGTADELLKSGGEINVSRYLVCSTATSPHQVVSINDFIIDECSKHPEFIGFGTLHPDFDDIEAEIDRFEKAGLRGIKLHPDFQQFYIDDEKMFGIYKAAEGRLPILMHMGDGRYDYSRPKRLESVIKTFSNLEVFAAHLGGYERWDEAAACLWSDRVYFDTSSSLEFLSRDKAVDLIRAFGADKVFFGTDFPMWTHLDELKRFISLRLDDCENKKILSQNFKKYFSV